jgi:hypothetical protein
MVLKKFFRKYFFSSAGQISIEFIMSAVIISLVFLFGLMMFQSRSQINTDYAAQGGAQETAFRLARNINAVYLSDGNISFSDSFYYAAQGYYVESGSGSVIVWFNANSFVDAPIIPKNVDFFVGDLNGEIFFTKSGDKVVVNYSSEVPEEEEPVPPEEDTTPPVIYLGLPENGTTDSDGVVDFSYTVTDDSSIESCELIINAVSKVSADSAPFAEFANYSFTSAGTYVWDVNCTDEYGNEGSSGSPRTLTYSLPVYFANKAGGTAADYSTGVAVDSAGNSYVTGYILGNANFGSISLECNGYADIVVAKAGPDGNWLWAKRAGSDSAVTSYYDAGQSVAVDSEGNVYITGQFQGNASFGNFNLNSISAGPDIFVAKLDTDGNWLWAVMVGSTSIDSGYGITVGSDDNAYVTGYYRTTISFDAIALTTSGVDEIFVGKINPDGNWVWVNKAGGTSYDYGKDIFVESNGNIFVTGYFRSATATFGSTVLDRNAIGNYFDMFVAKIGSDGNWLWAKNAGVPDQEVHTYGYGVAADSSHNVYVAGRFDGDAFFGNIDLNVSGNSEIFVVKLDSLGSWLWAKQAGSDTVNGSNFEGASDIAIGTDGNAYLTGYVLGTAYFGTTSFVVSSVRDAFLASIDPNGNWLRVENTGGAGFDFGMGIAIDSQNESYICGTFSSTVAFDAASLASAGSYDMFMWKVDQSG